MRNKLGMSLALTLTISAGLGCGTLTDLTSGKIDPGKLISPPASPEASASPKSGVPECESLLEAVAEYAKSENDSLPVRAAKEYFIGGLRQSVKESIDKYSTDKAKLAKECSDLKKKLDLQLANDKQGSNK